MTDKTRTKCKTKCKRNGHALVSFCSIVLLFMAALAQATTEQVIEYEYDGGGNIILIKSSAQSLPPQIDHLSPNFINVGHSAAFVIRGQNLLNAQITTSSPHLSVAHVNTRLQQIHFTLIAAASAPLSGNGDEAQIIVTTALGSASIAIIIAGEAPVISTLPSPMVFAVAANPHELTLLFSAPRPEEETYQVTIDDPAIASSTLTELVVSAGQTRVTLPVMANGLGSSVLRLVLAQKHFSFALPLFVSETFERYSHIEPTIKGDRNIFAAPVRVLKGQNQQSLFSMPVGLAVQSNRAENHNLLSLPVGLAVGDGSQGIFSPLVGVIKGQNQQSLFSMPVGLAVQSNRAENHNLLSLPVGLAVGDGSQGIFSPLVGVIKGQSQQSLFSLPVGLAVGDGSQGIFSPLVGVIKGQNQQSLFSTPVGLAVQSNRAENHNLLSLPVGLAVGDGSQGIFSPLVGVIKGQSQQSLFSLPVGLAVGDGSQGIFSPLVGVIKGQNQQSLFSMPVGLAVQSNRADNHNLLSLPVGLAVGIGHLIFAPQVEAVSGPLMDHYAPRQVTVGSFDLIIAGVNLTLVTAVTSVPDTDIILGEFVVSQDGKQLSIPVTIAAGAQSGERIIQLRTANGVVVDRSGRSVAVTIQ